MVKIDKMLSMKELWIAIGFGAVLYLVCCYTARLENMLDFKTLKVSAPFRYDRVEGFTMLES